MPPPPFSFRFHYFDADAASFSIFHCLAFDYADDLAITLMPHTLFRFDYDCLFHPLFSFSLTLRRCHYAFFITDFHCR
jgi:hypothetical protein